MLPDAGTCRHCGSRTGFIRNLETGRLTIYVACGHCDSACKGPCQRCAHMNHPVRIIKKPEGGDAAAGPM